MKTSRISLNQMFTLIFLFLIAGSTLTAVGRSSGQNIWIVILIAAVFGSILFIIYHRISYLHGYCSLSDILKDVFGTFLGTLVVLGYSLYFLYMGSNVLNAVGNMIQFTLLQGVNVSVLMGILLIVLIYGMMLGLNVIGRSSELMFYLVIISFIPLIIGVFSSDIFSFHNLLPILENGFKAIMPDIYRTTFHPYGQLISFLVIFPLIPKKSSHKILKVGFGAIVIATLFLLIIDIINVGILGSDLLFNFVYPFFNSMKMVGVNVFFERLDPLAIIILMTTCFFKLCIYFYAGVSSLDRLFKKLNYRQFTIPVAILMLIFCHYFYLSQVRILNQVLNFNTKYIYWVFELALPALIWMISEIKYHMHSKEKSETP